MEAIKSRNNKKDDKGVQMNQRTNKWIMELSTQEGVSPKQIVQDYNTEVINI